MCFALVVEFAQLWLQLTQVYALWHLTIRRGREASTVRFGLVAYVMYVSLCVADTSCVQLTPVVRVSCAALGSLAGVSIHAARGDRAA